MAKQHFNKDLDDYLHRRKSNGRPGTKLRIRFGKDQDEMPSLSSRKTHVIERKPSFLERLFAKKQPEDVVMTTEDGRRVETMEKQIMDVDEQMHELEREEQRLERKKDSLLVKLFNFLNKPKRVEEEDVDMSKINLPEEKGLDQETIETLKIASKWLNKLSTEEKRAFRESHDYLKYKSFLDKQGLTRK